MPPAVRRIARRGRFFALQALSRPLHPSQRRALESYLRTLPPALFPDPENAGPLEEEVGDNFSSVSVASVPAPPSKTSEVIKREEHVDLAPPPLVSRPRVGL